MNLEGHRIESEAEKYYHYFLQIFRRIKNEIKNVFLGVSRIPKCQIQFSTHFFGLKIQNVIWKQQVQQQNQTRTASITLEISENR